MASKQDITSLYKGKIRIRVCGILIENEKLLLVKHDGLGAKGTLWIPPGGGVEYGEKIVSALKREFEEEVGLKVKALKFLFVNEHIENGLHAVELFFLVNRESGAVKIGKDPEFGDNQQLIKDAKFHSSADLDNFPPEILHSLFNHVKNKDGLISFERLLNLEDKYLF